MASDPDPAFARTADAPEPAVHVVAGVITDARGRTLLARRTRGRDLAGLWEFPGGKVDTGETPQQALHRELQEELGIDARIGSALICVPQCYPHKRIRLDVYRVAGWNGPVKALDGQALAWVPPHRLASYSMPPADRPVVAALQDPDRYLVTPAPDAAGGVDEEWLSAVQHAAQSGLRRIQLRAPGVERSHWHRLIGQAIDRCRAHDVQWLVNGDVQAARELQVGLHMPSRQLLDTTARPLPLQQPLAASCHTLDELRHAAAIGCDWVVLGPVHATASHPEAAGIGWPAFERLREQVDLPIYAIGGLTPDDIGIARSHGAQGIAAIRGLWPAAVESR